MNTEEHRLWNDPRGWSVLRRAKLWKNTGAGAIVLGTLLAVPALWILLMPRDTLLRPYMTHDLAIATLVVCAILLYAGRKIAREVREGYGRALYTCFDRTRKAGLAQGVIYDVDLPQIYPRILFARRHRVMAVALPHPALFSIDEIADVTAQDNGMITLTMKDTTRPSLNVLAGDGLYQQSSEETLYVAERLREFVFLPHNTLSDEERQQEELTKAFLASPSLLRS